MAKLVYETTAAQDEGLAHVTAVENVRRAALPQPLKPLSTEEYFQWVVGRALASYAREAVERDTAAVGEAFSQMDADQRAAIRDQALAEAGK